MAMDKNIKGIIVEIGGNTMKLNEALNESSKSSKKLETELAAVESKLKFDPTNVELLTRKQELLAKQMKLTEESSKSLQGELKSIDKLLKFDPTNVELLAQKHELLSQQAEKAKNKVDALRQAQEQVNKMLANGDIDESAYRNFERQLISAEQQLQSTENQLNDTKDAINRYSGAVSEAGETTVTFGDLLKSSILGDLIADGLRTAAGAAKDFISNGVELASDLQEVKNVVDTTFGDGANKIYQWADAAAEGFGMSSLNAQKFIGTMGSMLKSMGFTTDAAADMSTTMVGLAGDMASFYNLDVETAFEKIRAGISGETEPLKQLGINMSVANLEAYALSEGITKAYSSMTQAEQAQLRYNYLLSATADAQGDFAKTSDSFANQQKILQLNIENLSASLGEKLIPHLNDVLVTLNDKLPSAAPNIERIGSLIGNLTTFALDNADAIIAMAAAYGAFTGANAIGNGIMTVVECVKSLKAANDAATASQVAMNTAANANPYVLVASAIAALTVGVIAYANATDSAMNSIKDINREIDNLNQNTQKRISDTEGEIAVLKSKADRYEALISVENRTAGEEAELIDLAKELQAYMPEGTVLINEQTGAYNSLAGSIDKVTEAMRINAYISAYKDEYEGLTKQLIEAEKIQESLKGKNSMSIYEMNTWNKSVDTINDTKQQLEDLDAKLAELYETAAAKSAETETAVANSVSLLAEHEKAKGIAAKEAAEEYSQSQQQAIKDYETKTQEAVDNIEKRYKLHQTTENQYYSELEAYLSGHVNNQSTLYWELTDKVSDYYDKQAKAAETSAAKTAKSAETQSNKELSTAKSKLSKLLDLYKKGSISAEEYNKEYTALLAEYSEHQVELTEIAQEKMTEITEAEATKRVEALKKSIEQEIAEYQKEYEAVQKQIESFANSVGKSYKDMYTFETDEKTGKLVAKTTDKMIQGQKEAQKYLDNINKLQDRGVSNTMLQQLTSMSREEGIATAEYWMSLTDRQLKNLDGNWRKYTNINKQISEALYEDKAKSAAKGMLSAIGETLAESDTELKDTGLKILQSIADGVLDEAGTSEIKAICDGIISTMTEYFSDSKANITLDASVNEGKATAAKSTGKTETSTVAADYTQQYMDEVYAKNTSSGNKEIVLPDVSSVSISTLAVTNETEKAKKQEDYSTNITKKLDELIAGVYEIRDIQKERQTVEATFYITTSTDIDGITFSKMVTDVVRKELK